MHATIPNTYCFCANFQSKITAVQDSPGTKDWKILAQNLVGREKVVNL